MVTNKLYNKWHTKKTCDFKGVCLYETVKVAVSAHVIIETVDGAEISMIFP